PDQPTNIWPLAGVGVSVTEVPWGKVAAHAVFPFPQEMAAEAPLTTPLPVTLTESARVLTCGTRNDALTVWLDPSVKLHAPVPVQAPDQPPKTEPPVGVAVRLTTVPIGSVSGHVPWAVVHAKAAPS